MDVKVFKTFLEVAKERHFGRAAENLYITQAAVSARIKQLESYFGARLFLRDRNAIRLTPSGERLISYADIMVNTLEQAKFDLSLESGQALQLTIGGAPDIWDAYLQSCLSLITDKFKGYAFTANALSREQIYKKLLDKTLDMALALDPVNYDELCCTKVSSLVLTLVSSKPCSVEQALENNYVYVDWGTRFSSEHAERHPTISAPYLRTSTGRIALDFIVEKGGTAYLPQSMIEPYLASGDLYKVSEIDEWCKPIYLSYRRANNSIEAIKKIEHLLISPSANKKATSEALAPIKDHTSSETL
ncbi:LysR family transcriptional regulator [Vibrio sp. S4M6]|uniref:LysR family transcriptional regulator n=1 Tax=Vibrio sinus TaxID=2946865 RepID=UPI00202A9EAF|nr:LysR family transcriptional regulator [Vibrio sinus]MCL9780594.1 LysR family transcriptional regulator [Vibrio sinus]